jgi:hypothetical protein
MLGNSRRAKRLAASQEDTDTYQAHFLATNFTVGPVMKFRPFNTYGQILTIIISFFCSLSIVPQKLSLKVLNLKPILTTSTTICFVGRAMIR